MSGEVWTYTPFDPVVPFHPGVRAFSGASAWSIVPKSESVLPMLHG